MGDVSLPGDESGGDDAALAPQCILSIIQSMKTNFEAT
jgi:hypothetical protein